MDDISQQDNDRIEVKDMKLTIKKTIYATILAFAMACGTAFGQGDGRALLGTIRSNQPVVTQEVDSVFTSWTNANQVAFKADTNNFYIGGKSVAQILDEKREADPMFDRFQNSQYNISLGSGTSSSYSKGVAIGVPALNSYQDGDFTYATSGTGTNYYWRQDYMGNVKAARESVAIGDSAQARYPVAVAIGDQAIVGALHTDYPNDYGVVVDKMVVTKRIAGETTTFTTNIFENAITNWYNGGQYERLPERDSGWTQIGSPVTTAEVGSTNTVYTYQTKTSGALRDISYLNSDEWAYYNRNIYGGQGNVPLVQAYYGVAVGSRSYVFGYHGVALGHYSHVSRPWGMAIGSEAHVYSEGAQGIGYDVDIATNAPYTLAIGHSATVTPGITNAIVIGVPDASTRGSSGTPTQRPTAVKSNSINFVYHGNGIQDFYIDGKSLQTRLGSEVKVIGNSDKGGDITSDSVRDTLGIDDGDHIVFASSGKIMLYTKSYVEDIDTENVHLDEIVINNKPLSQILNEQAPSGGADTEFRAKVQNAAEVAQNELATNATNMVRVKAILTNFFNTIKQ